MERGFFRLSEYKNVEGGSYLTGTWQVTVYRTLARNQIKV